MVFAPAAILPKEKLAEAERDRLMDALRDLLARADYEGQTTASQATPADHKAARWVRAKAVPDRLRADIYSPRIWNSVVGMLDLRPTGQPTRFENSISRLAM